MFGINDNVVHKNAGVCIVSDIVIKDFGNGKQTYYFLKPKFPSIANKSLEIFLPLEKESVMIRRPMNKDEALTLIQQIPAMEQIWVNDTKKRKISFEEISNSGDIKKICQLVKLLYADATFFIKPMSLTDKNFLTKLKTHLFDEFAIALNILPDEVETFIKQFMTN